MYCPFARFLANGFAWIMVILAAACTSNTAIQENLAYRAVLYGRVQSSAGAPVAGATVAIAHHPSRCGAGAAESTSTTTNSAGRYRQELTVLTSADGCVRLNVTATGFAPDSASVTGVPFRQPPALDSIETNIVLR